MKEGNRIVKIIREKINIQKQREREKERKIERKIETKIERKNDVRLLLKFILY